jgi:hypothetical protein
MGACLRRDDDFSGANKQNRIRANIDPATRSFVSRHKLP